MNQVPKNKKILLFLTPLTYTEYKKLSALGILPANFFKIIKLLKINKNKVFILNLYPGDNSLQKNETHIFWKYKNEGVENKTKTKVFINSKYSFDETYNNLKNLDFKPDEIWISCSFSYNYDLVIDYIKIFKKLFPSSKIVISGSIARHEKLIKKIKPDDIFSNYVELQNIKMDFSETANLDYGVFTIQKGCIFKCTFCDNEKKISVTDLNILKEELQYIKENIKPQNIWNFDPNILLIGERRFIDFLEVYHNLNIKSRLSFYKGFQPNLLTQNIIEYLKYFKLYWITIPFDVTTYYSHIQFKKPYTIISAIKAINKIKNAKIDINTIVTSAVIGYPDDNLHHIMRSYLLSWYMNTLYAVSPVAINPGTYDYLKYYSILKNKDISEYDGRLWPLLSYDKVITYKKLFKFLTYKETNNNMSLLVRFLPAKLNKIFYIELENVRKFIEYCINSKKDDLDTLKKIEEAIWGKLM